MLRPIKITSDIRVILLFLVVWVIGMIILYDIHPFKMLSSEWVRTTHLKYNFSLEHPEKWSVQQYDDGGRKGNETIKLQMIENLSFGFEVILVRRIEAEQPTLTETANWDDRRLEELGQDALNRGEPGYEELSLKEESLRDTPILRRTYMLRGFMFEAVYIARSRDMIIITMATTQAAHDEYMDEFNRIINSFEPLE